MTRILGVDIETCDPDLKKMGSGARRPDSYVVGVALAWANERYEIQLREYIPLRHQEQRIDDGDEPAWDEDSIAVARMRIQDAVDEADGFVGANLMYDIEFLDEKEGIDFHIWERGRHKYVDVQVVEPILDENKQGSYSLEDLAQHYGVGTKDDTELYEWLAQHYGGKPTRAAQAGRIYLAPIHLVEPYALSDSSLPIEIFACQKQRIRQEGLSEIWALERDLFPMLYAMKKRGVRIDVEKAHTNQKKLDESFERIVSEFASASGLGEEHDLSELANSTAQIAAIIDNWNQFLPDDEKIVYPHTDRGAPSIRKDWLEGQAQHGNHMMRPFAQAILDYRRVEKNRGTFIQGILKHLVDDRVHCQFNQLKSDAGGTVSGRFSSSNPNLQNQPARDEEMGPLVRGLFVPDENEDWGSADYSQIEYRLLVHHAFVYFARKNRDGSLLLVKADEDGRPILDAAGALQPDPHGATVPISKRYEREFYAAREMLLRFIRGAQTGEKVDMHEEVGEMCDIPRRDGKTINFGMVYGLGVESLISKLGYSRERCMQIMDAYHGSMPFAKKIYQEIQSIARRGIAIETIGRRKRRYPKVQLSIPWKWDVSRDGEMPYFYAEFMRPDADGRTYSRNTRKRPPVYGSVDEFLAAYPEEDREKVRYEFAFCHTGLNALLQGGAADIMKRAMLDIWNAGICDVLGAPLLTVHDELNWSIPRTPEAREAFRESVRIMEAVYRDRLTIPLLVEFETGANWAECK